MTANLDALAAPGMLTGPECECKCGETLPPGSTRRYKRGHKPVSSPEPKPFIMPDLPEVSDASMDTMQAITLDEAAKNTPDDPDPADWKEQKISVRITKAVKDDIAGKLGMLFGFMTVGLSMKDPICAKAVGDNAEHIIPKLVPIICKSPDMVRWFTSKNSGYIVYFELMMVCWPVIQVFIGHHVTHSIGPAKGAGPDGTVMPNAQVPRYRA